MEVTTSHRLTSIYLIQINRFRKSIFPQRVICNRFHHPFDGANTHFFQSTRNALSFLYGSSFSIALQSVMLLFHRSSPTLTKCPVSPSGNQGVGVGLGFR